jgi:phage FluMu protein Com
MKVHWLVARAFLGPRPDGMEIRHLDGDYQNCTASNLLYGTKSENALDAVQHGTHRETRKVRCPACGGEYAKSSLGKRVCPACQQKNKAAYQERNPEVVRQSRRDWKKRNPEAVRKAKREWAARARARRKVELA